MFTEPSATRRGCVVSGASISGHPPSGPVASIGMPSVEEDVPRVPLDTAEVTMEAEREVAGPE